MTQEQKDLLLKDLCARLPYGVKVQYENEIFDLEYVCPMYEEVKLDNYETWTLYLEEVKPYLFPLSNMTDKQIMKSPISIQVCDLENLRYDSVCTELNNRFPDLIDLIDWLNKNHFDYRGLIEKGLAIDATGKNIY